MEGFKVKGRRGIEDNEYRQLFQGVLLQRGMEKQNNGGRESEINRRIFKGYFRAYFCVLMRETK